MKDILKVFLYSGLTLLIACDLTRIDVEPVNPTEADNFTNAAEFRRALYGAYSDIYDIYGFVTRDGSQHRGLYNLWYIPGDDLTETQGARTQVEVFDGQLNPSYDPVNDLWASSYEIIQKSNVVIDKVNTIDFSGFDDPGEIAVIGGEALFLRAYTYYRIFNLWGGAPLITKRIISDEEINQPKVEASLILDQVIADASAAESSLREAWDADNIGRATKNAARALLVKALVMRANYFGSSADYSEALTTFGRITNSLLTDYSNNFNTFDENNAESCFEWQAGNATSGRGSNIFLNNGGPWRGVENLLFFRGFMMSPTNSPGAEATWQSVTKLIVTDKLLNLAGNDPRIAFWLAPIAEGMILEKYTKPGYNQQSPRHQNSVNNERVLRYGDLKLFAAEAALKSGNTAAAIGHINDVRARANVWGASLTDSDLDAGIGVAAADLALPTPRDVNESNSTTIMQWIMEERFVELAGEGHRWWDLKRWHAAGDIDLAGWGGGDTEFSTFLDDNTFGFDVSKHILFPIPQGEIDRNSSINENNPGY